MTSHEPIPLVFRYGLHRVRDAVRVLPQAAWSVESNPALGGGSDYELVIEVERLNIDAASFRQMEEAARQTSNDLSSAASSSKSTAAVEQRGKMHNPVTGSGGMCWVESVTSVPSCPSRTDRCVQASGWRRWFRYR